MLGTKRLRGEVAHEYIAEWRRLDGWVHRHHHAKLRENLIRGGKQDVIYWGLFAAILGTDRLTRRQIEMHPTCGRSSQTSDSTTNIFPSSVRSTESRTAWMESNSAFDSDAMPSMLVYVINSINYPRHDQCAFPLWFQHAISLLDSPFPARCCAHQSNWRCSYALWWIWRNEGIGSIKVIFCQIA